MNKEIQRLNWWLEDDDNHPAHRIKGKDADEAFALFSERGIKPDLYDLENPIRYKKLCESKRWEGIQIQMWEDGNMDGSMPYRSLLGWDDPKEMMPRFMVNFIKKEMFKGIDAEIIEEVYQEVLKKWNWWRKLLFRLGFKF